MLLRIADQQSATINMASKIVASFGEGAIAQELRIPDLSQKLNLAVVKSLRLPWHHDG